MKKIKGTIEIQEDKLYAKVDCDGMEEMLPVNVWEAWKGNEVGRMAGTGLSLNFEVMMMKEYGKRQCRCGGLQEFMKCEHYVGPPINDCTYGDLETVRHAKVVRDRTFVEALGLMEFAEEGDDGLFPNHTDKDIWLKGFSAGYECFRKNNR